MLHVSGRHFSQKTKQWSLNCHSVLNYWEQCLETTLNLDLKKTKKVARWWPGGKKKNKHQSKTCPSMATGCGARQTQQEPGRPVAHSLTGCRSIHQQEGGHFGFRQDWQARDETNEAAVLAELVGRFHGRWIRQLERLQKLLQGTFPPKKNTLQRQLAPPGLLSSP